MQVSMAGVWRCFIDTGHRRSRRNLQHTPVDDYVVVVVVVVAMVVLVHFARFHSATKLTVTASILRTATSMRVFVCMCVTST